jgi:hypothetical protein
MSLEIAKSADPNNPLEWLVVEKNGPNTRLMARFAAQEDAETFVSAVDNLPKLKADLINIQTRIAQTASKEYGIDLANITVDELTKVAVCATMARTKNRGQAAASLGIGQRTLFNYLLKWGWGRRSVSPPVQEAPNQKEYKPCDSEKQSANSI